MNRCMDCAGEGDLLHQGDLGFPPGQGLDLLGHALQLLCVEQHFAGPRGAHVNLQSDQAT